MKEFNLETLEGRAQAASFAIPIVNKINNSVIKEIYTSEVSKLCGMDIKTMDVSPSPAIEKKQKMSLYQMQISQFE